MENIKQAKSRKENSNLGTIHKIIRFLGQNVTYRKTLFKMAQLGVSLVLVWSQVFFTKFSKTVDSGKTGVIFLKAFEIQRPMRNQIP